MTGSLIQRNLRAVRKQVKTRKYLASTVSLPMRQTVNPVQLLWAPCVFFRWESAATPIQPPIFLFVCRSRPPLGRGHPILSYITPTHSLHNRDRNCPPQWGNKIFGDRPQRSNKLNWQGSLNSLSLHPTVIVTHLYKFLKVNHAFHHSEVNFTVHWQSLYKLSLVVFSPGKFKN